MTPVNRDEKPFCTGRSSPPIAEKGRYHTPSPPSEHQTWTEAKEQAQIFSLVKTCPGNQAL